MYAPVSKGGPSLVKDANLILTLTPQLFMVTSSCSRLEKMVMEELPELWFNFAVRRREKLVVTFSRVAGGSIPGLAGSDFPFQRRCDESDLRSSQAK